MVMMNTMTDQLSLKNDVFENNDSVIQATSLILEPSSHQAETHDSHVDEQQESSSCDNAEVTIKVTEDHEINEDVPLEKDISLERSMDDENNDDAVVKESTQMADMASPVKLDEVSVQENLESMKADEEKEEQEPEIAPPQDDTIREQEKEETKETEAKDDDAPVLVDSVPVAENKGEPEGRRSLSRSRRPSHRYDNEFESIKDIGRATPSKLLEKEELVTSDLSEKSRSGVNREQMKFCSNVVKLVKKHRDAWPFLTPVDPIKLGIPDYLDIVKQPMDISTIETKLSNLEYKTVQDFLDDFKLIFTNCYTYNTPDSDVVVMAQNLERFFEAQVSRMPKEEQRADSLDGTEDETMKEKPKRKHSVDATDSAEKKPRRASTPKTPTSLKKKTKGNPELYFCAKIWKELTNKKITNDAWPFMEPVDYVKLNLTDYPEIVRNPIDLTTIKKKLDDGTYSSAAEFAADMQLMFSNCCLYNPPDSDIFAMGNRLRKSFEEKFAQMPDFSKKPLSSDLEGDNDILIDGDERDVRIRELERHLLDAQSQLESLRKGKRKSNEKPLKTVSRRPSTGGSAHKPKKSAYDLDEVDILRPMTFDEKRQLSIDIGRLPTDRLDKVVEIIQKYSPLTKGDASNEIEVDIDALDTRALRHLEVYVQSVLGKKRPTPKKTKPAAATRRPEARPANVQSMTRADLSSSSSSIYGSSDSESDSDIDAD